MKNPIQLLLCLLLGIFVTSCNSASKSAKSPIEEKAVGLPGPRVIIYKTKKDYSKLVPVILSDDRKTIVSYPDVKDVIVNGLLAYPTSLHNGFWLDNRGISENVAFLNVTYEAYSRMKKTPTPDELKKMILVKKPLVCMYRGNLKSSYQNLEQELNELIDKADFSSFRKLK